MPTMLDIPKEARLIRAKISRYERKLAEEKRGYGSYDDSAGRRYMLGPLYMVLGDEEGAQRSFEWFDAEFPDDGGESGQLLCRALLLHRLGREEAAGRTLRQVMFQNRFVVPRLLGESIAGLELEPEDDEWDQSVAEEVPAEFLQLWSEEERKWGKEQYRGQEYVTLRARYMELKRALEGERVGPRRKQLVDQLWSLRRAETGR